MRAHLPKTFGARVAFKGEPVKFAEYDEMSEAIEQEKSAALAFLRRFDAVSLFPQNNVNDETAAKFAARSVFRNDEQRKFIFRF